jgi:flagellar biosynthesis/type III secretory pathway chaperone
MQRFFAMLDDEIRLLEALVQVTQEEHGHLLALETEKLEPVVAEKRRLLERSDDIRRARERVVHSSLKALRAPTDAHRLSDLIPLVSPGNQKPLLARRDQIRALSETLRELNEASGVYARRHLRWVRAARKKLGADAGTELDLYDSNGRAAVEHEAGRRLGVRV